MAEQQVLWTLRIEGTVINEPAGIANELAAMVVHRDEGMECQRFFIYARKSTDDDDRQVRSIDDQIAVLRELVKKDGLGVVVVMEKQSAKQPGRPVCGEMLSRIEQGEASRTLGLPPRPPGPKLARRRAGDLLGPRTRTGPAGSNGPSGS